VFNVLINALADLLDSTNAYLEGYTAFDSAINELCPRTRKTQTSLPGINNKNAVPLVSGSTAVASLRQYTSATGG
jgi:hypothetical protein